MTIFAFALYNYERLMMLEELRDAQHLAKKADEGDREAAKLLRQWVLHAIRCKQEPR